MFACSLCSGLLLCPPVSVSVLAARCPCCPSFCACTVRGYSYLLRPSCFSSFLAPLPGGSLLFDWFVPASAFSPLVLLFFFGWASCGLLVQLVCSSFALYFSRLPYLMRILVPCLSPLRLACPGSVFSSVWRLCRCLFFLLVRAGRVVFNYRSSISFALRTACLTALDVSFPCLLFFSRYGFFVLSFCFLVYLLVSPPSLLRLPPPALWVRFALAMHCSVAGFLPAVTFLFGVALFVGGLLHPALAFRVGFRSGCFAPRLLRCARFRLQVRLSSWLSRAASTDLFCAAASSFFSFLTSPFSLVRFLWFMGPPRALRFLLLRHLALLARGVLIEPSSPTPFVPLRVSSCVLFSWSPLLFRSPASSFLSTFLLVDSMLSCLSRWCRCVPPYVFTVSPLQLLSPRCFTPISSPLYFLSAGCFWSRLQVAFLFFRLRL